MFGLSLLTSKLTGPIATAACVVLAVLLLLCKCENAGLTSDNDKLTKSINDPVTGWAAKLNTCQGSVASLQAGIDGQNHAVDALAVESNRRTSLANKMVAAAREDALQAQIKAGGILAAKSTNEPCSDALALIRETVR